MALTYIKSNKGHNLLVHRGYTYRVDKIGLNKKYWKCTEYDNIKIKCTARCVTQESTIIKVSKHLSHPPDAAMIEKRKLMSDMKEKATATQESTHQIVASASIGVSSAVAGKLPPVPYIKRSIQRLRQGVQIPAINPVNLTQLIIPNEYTLTANGNPFLLHDSGPSPDRILIFSTLRNLDLMAQSHHWFADGTFKVTPPLFSQVYTIHVIKYHNVIPTVIVLMPNKTEASYNRVFNALKNLNGNLNPRTIMTDFELASIKAFKRAFPNAEQRGCFFHLTQCVFRQIQQNSDAYEKYKSDPDFALQLKLLPCLAFVQVNDVIEYFEELSDSSYYVENIQLIGPILNYFEDTWIGRFTRRNQRQIPLFPIALWNCYAATLEDLPKTNNAVEGWHNSFNKLLGAAHPTIWKFIMGLKKEQSLNELKIEQYISGQNLLSGKRIYKDTAEKIKSHVLNYPNSDRMEYLRSIAHNFSFQV